MNFGYILIIAFVFYCLSFSIKNKIPPRTRLSRKTKELRIGSYAPSKTMHNNGYNLMLIN